MSTKKNKVYLTIEQRGAAVKLPDQGRTAQSVAYQFECGRTQIKLKATIQNSHQARKKRRLTPEEEAEFWCESGLDKEGFTTKYISDYKGFGVFATETHRQGDFLLEYVGERLSVEEGEERERKHSENKMFFFSHKGTRHCIDACATEGHICQYVNDSEKKNANSVIKVKDLRGTPRLCLYALTDIQSGEELLYDYGDDTKNLWWRTKDATKGCQKFNFDDNDDDDDDDDPFDLGKVSDLSSDDTDSLSYEDIEVVSGTSESDTQSEVISVLSRRKINPDLPKKARQSEPIDEDDVSPHVCVVAAKPETNQAPPALFDPTISDDRPGPAPRKPAPASPKSVVREQAVPLNQPRTSSMGAVRGSSDNIERRNQYKKPDLDSKHGGDSNTMLKYVKISKKSDKVLEAMDVSIPVNLSRTPPPPPAFTNLSSDDTDSLSYEDIEVVSGTSKSDTQSEVISVPSRRKKSDKVLEAMDVSIPVNLSQMPPPPPDFTAPSKLSAREVQKEASQWGGEQETGPFAVPHSSEDEERSQCDASTAPKPVMVAQLQQLDKDKKEEGNKSKAPQIKTRPNRMCCFCKKIITGGKMKRHIITHRITHEEVAAILTKPKQEQNKWFENKRTEGMYLYNLDHLNDGELMRERKSKNPDELRMCLGCKRFFSNRTFYKHKQMCSSQSEALKPQSLQPLNIHRDSEFVVDILNKFRDGEAGNFIRQSKLVQVIGYKHYLARNAESSKFNEVRKEVMMEMREITRIFLCFQSIAETTVTFEDMFKRENLTLLKEAFNKMCEGEKHGLKVNLNSIFQKSTKILSGYYAECSEDSKLKQLRKFKEAYDFNLPEIIGGARYHTQKNSLMKARLPKNLPIEADIKTLKSFICSEIDFTVRNFTLSSYTWLRCLVVARLTLYNARRGEEGSRLLLEEWSDAMKEAWVPKGSVEQLQDDCEKYLVGQFKLAYLAGKGRKHVPLLIPTDLIQAVVLLIENRAGFGILENNHFLFATKSSKAHCSGWHAVAAVCESAGVSVNATKNRHRASTVYATLDMTEADRRIFFDHLGHHESINKENYQCPPGLNEIRVMGQFLNSLDDGNAAAHRTGVAPSPSGDAPSPSGDTPSPSVDRPSTSGVSPSPSGVTPSPKRKNVKGGSFHWTPEATALIKEHFSKWIEMPTGNKLPGKQDLEHYLNSSDMTCTLLQLKTKIMNEQNKRRQMRSRKLKKLTG